MAPGEYFTFEVQFTAPSTAGTYGGMGTVNGTSQPPISVPLTASVGSELPDRQPRLRGLRLASPACPALTRQINVVNGCCDAGHGELGDHRGGKHRR